MRVGPDVKLEVGDDDIFGESDSNDEGIDVGLDEEKFVASIVGDTEAWGVGDGDGIEERSRDGLSDDCIEG